MRGQGRVYLRGQVWWIEWWHNSTGYRESSRSLARKDALELLNKRLADRDQGLLPRSRAQQLRLAQVFSAYLTDLEVREVASLETSVRSHLKPVQAFFGNYKPEQVNQGLLDAYKKTRKDSGRAISTINAELRLLRAALRCAHRRGQIPRVPPIPLLTGEHVREGFFEWEELQAMLPYLPAYLQPLALFAYWTGWRRKELTTLEWRDIDWTHGVIRLRAVNSKTQKGRVVGMSHALRAILEGQWTQRVLDDQLIPYVFHRKGRRIVSHYKAWRKAGRLAGIPGKLLHDCRRTAARNLIFAGIPERVAMQVTGHATRAVFDRYTIVAPAQTESALDATEAYVQGQAKKVVNFRQGRGE